MSEEKGDISVFKQSDSSWKCKGHEVQNHDIFINYRAWCEKELARSLHYALGAEKKLDGANVIPFLDQICMREGESWETSFLNGLENAAVILMLISEDAITGIKNAHKRQDTLLLEYEYALEKFEKKQAFILPCYVGRNVEGGLYKAFNNPPLTIFPDEVHVSDRSTKNIRQTMQRLFEIRGIKINPDHFQDKLPEIRKFINDSLQALGRMGTIPDPQQEDWKSRSVNEWTVAHVQKWLDFQELDPYMKAFFDNAVDGKDLIALTESELKEELGITRPLHLKKIKRLIGELIEESHKLVESQAQEKQKLAQDVAAGVRGVDPSKPFVVVNGRKLVLGENVRTCELDEAQWEETKVGSENPSAVIPLGWRLATKQEAVEVAKLKAKFGTHVLLHMGCVDGGEDAHPIITANLYADRAGQNWTTKWSVTASDYGNPGSVLKQNNASGRYLLVKVDKAWTPYVAVAGSVVVNGRRLTLGDNVRTCALGPEQWDAREVGTESPLAIIPAGWRLATRAEAVALALLKARFGTHVLMHEGNIEGGEEAYPIITYNFQSDKVGQNWREKWDVEASNFGNPGSILKQSLASGRYLLIKVDSSWTERKEEKKSVYVDGRELVAGVNLRTCVLEPSAWNDREIGTESPSAIIPQGWRLATRNEAVAAAKLKIRFGTHVFLHEGCLDDGEEAYPIINHNLNPEKAGQNWSQRWIVSSTDRGNPGSVLSQTKSSGRYLLVKLDAAWTPPKVASVAGVRLALGDNVRTINMDPHRWDENSVGTESTQLTIPEGWRLATFDEAVAVAKLRAKFGTHVFMHAGCIEGGEQSYPVITALLDPVKAGQPWSSKWVVTAPLGGRPGSTVFQSSSNGRYLLVRLGASVIVNGVRLTMGDNVRTINLGPHAYAEPVIGTETGSYTIPAGWRLATRDEAIAIAKLKARFGTHVFLHQGNLEIGSENSYPIINAAQEEGKVGLNWSSKWAVTATNGPYAGSLLTQSQANGRYLLVRADGMGGAGLGLAGLAPALRAASPLAVPAIPVGRVSPLPGGFGGGLGPSTFVNGLKLQLGDNVRTCLLGPEQWAEAQWVNTCPGRHGLSRQTASHGSYLCNLCRGSIAQYSEMQSCRTCDWDVCRSCVTRFASAQVGTENPEAQIPAGWRLASVEEAIAVAKMGAKFSTHVFMHTGNILGGEYAHPIITVNLNAQKVGEKWTTPWPVSATNGGQPGSILKCANSSGRYILIRIGGESKSPSRAASPVPAAAGAAAIGKSCVVNGKTLTLGISVRTCNLDESRWADTAVGTESPSAVIPAGWRLATKKEAQEIAKIGARFGTHVLMHAGCLLGAAAGDVACPIITVNLDPAKAGQDWSTPWPVTGSMGGQPGSVLKVNNSSGRYLLVRHG